MKIYISGPMTGLPDLNFPAFHDAAAKLRALGHEVTNPAEKQEENDPSMTWMDYMRLDIAMMMLNKCDAVALLQGYGHSKGAMTELNLAQSLGFDIRTIEDWLK